MEARTLTRERVERWIWFGFLGATLLTLSAPLLWIGELACGFRWHLGWVGLFGAAPLLHRHWKRVATIALLSVWHVWPEAGLFLGRPPDDGGAPTLKIACANLRWSNADTVTPLAWVRSEKADVLALSEVTEPWLPQLEELRDLYPHQLVVGSEDPWDDDTWGIGLLSKTPLIDTQVIALPDHDLPLLEGRVRFEGRELTVRTMHPLRPGTPGDTAERNRQLEAIFELDWPDGTLLMGDLNATTYTPVFRELCARAQLEDSRQGFGRQPSFTFGEYFGFGMLLPIGLAIDHVLVRPDIAVYERYCGPDVGSDHRPIVCRVGWRPETQPPSR